MTTQLIDLWTEARTRFSNLLPSIKEEDLLKKLPNTPNSAGFLIRHIGDVEFLFAKNVFKPTFQVEDLEGWRFSQTASTPPFLNLTSFK
jgi:hypothetical protein